jgi:hypothetical protein
MKTKGKKSVVPKYETMRPKGLKAATATFDQEFVAQESRPLNTEESALWAKAQRKPGRPKVSRRVRVISVSLERADHCRRATVTRKKLAAADQDLAAALPALLRAAAAARELSIRTGTPFYVMKNGRVVDLNAEPSAKRSGKTASHPRRRRAR